MIRGTTPTIKVNIKNVDLTKITAFFLTLKQNSIVVEKSLDDVTVDKTNSCVYVKLTQEDTLKLQNGPAELQIRFKDTIGDVLATKIKAIEIGRVLKGGVI